MPMSVLLVDDNPYVLALLTRALAVQGADAVRVVGAVVGGRGAVAQAWRLRPDVVLVDLTLPEVTGLQLLPRLRRMLPDAILIALSLLGRPAERDAAVAAGADGFVSKTRLGRDLLPTIQRLAAHAPRSGVISEEE